MFTEYGICGSVKGSEGGFLFASKEATFDEKHVAEVAREQTK